MTEHAVRTSINEFFSLKRIAFVGASRNERDFSRMLFKEFRRRAYDVIPVNPHAEEIDGVPCVAGVKDIHPAAEGALVMTSRDAAYRVLVECHEAGIRRVWLYGISGPGRVSAGAVEFCATHGISLVPGYCPFMFLPEPRLIHRCHRGVMKFLGTYPV
ncbi:MAG: CoA-binding protein [FCB group bacterium]|jgi:predicted CoA-binding protein|nr:CoA-binding protein [FCB group bacterium]